MSHLSANFKPNIEGQGVDVAREQERRARLQLLDDSIRGPQPIFAQPVKVEVEDETARRIKNTLGDFTQVLVQDPKSLIGISRHGPNSNRLLRKHPNEASRTTKTLDKRLPLHGKEVKNPAFLNINLNVANSNNVTINNINVNNNSVTTSLPGIYNCTETPAIQLTNPFHVPPPVNKRPAYSEYKHGTEFHAETFFRRCLEERGHSIPIETILKEMKLKVPPAPLTAIQTPRTEDTGFVFPKQNHAWSLDEKVEFTNNEPDTLSVPSFPTQYKETKTNILKTPEPPQITCSSVPTTSLQEDLEMSDSDDENRVTTTTNNTDTAPETNINNFLANEFNSIANLATSVVNASISEEQNNGESSNTSSSESGDSDSDDSSSESNDSDSSNETSNKSHTQGKDVLETPSDLPCDKNLLSAVANPIPSKKWGLSNFVNESQKIHSSDWSRENDAVDSVTIAPTYPFFTHHWLKDGPENYSSSQSQGPEVRVAPKSEILSPITSPMRTNVVGPRTPPSPVQPVIPEPAIKMETITSDNLPLQQSWKSENLLNNNKVEKKENDTCKMQLRSNSVKSEEPCDEVQSFPVLESYSGNKHEIQKVPFQQSSKDDFSLKDPISEKNNHSVSSPGSSSPPKSAPRKARKKSVTSTKKKDITIISNEVNQNSNSSATGIAKHAHPRACRKLSEKSNSQPTALSSSRSKPDAKKRVKQKIKAPLTPEKNSDTLKSSSKSDNKASGKSKAANVSVKQVPSETQTFEQKKRRKKFAIENFLQSPECQITGTKILSSSPKDSPIDNKRCSSDAEEEESFSLDSSIKLTKNSYTKEKNGKKLRRSARCSERASSTNAVEPVPAQILNEAKTNLKTGHKGKNRTKQPLCTESSLDVHSPTRQQDLVGASTDSAITFKIMVCIPLSKITRLPLTASRSTDFSSHMTKSELTFENNEQTQKNVTLSEKTPKSCSSKKIVSKDPKKKLPSKMIPDKKSSSDKKIKSFKSEADSTNNIKVSSSSNNLCNKKDKALVSSENKISRKRKSEDDRSVVKKQKLPNERISLNKNDMDESIKSKPIERCDSTCSLNSLGSQISQKGYKLSKDKNLASVSEPKRIKTHSFAAIEIKQEKDDKQKAHLKKDKSSGDKNKSKIREKFGPKNACYDKVFEQSRDVTLSSSQCSDDLNKDDLKGKQRCNQSLMDVMCRDSDWDNFAPDIQKQLKEAVASLNKPNNQAPIMPMDYYWTEGWKQKQLAENEKDPFQQAVKFFEAAVLFILTSQEREEYGKDPDSSLSAYVFYKETLKFSDQILSRVKKSCPGSTEFKLLILCLKCQSLLHVKLYSLKIKDLKEQLDGVTEYLTINFSSSTNANSSTQLLQTRLASFSAVASSHSPISTSQNTSLSIQNAGYNACDGSGSQKEWNLQQTVNVPQTMLDMICRQHTHLLNLHTGHDLWEQADMYMTRSNLREFFKEVADQSEPLTLHSSITELVKYIQKGISLIKKSVR